MKNISKLLFFVALCSGIVAGCKKNEPDAEKNPAQRLAGTYTVYDTLFYEEVAGIPCSGGNNEIKEYKADLTALTSKRVRISQLVGSDEGVGDIYADEIKLVLPHTSATKVLAYQDGNRIKIYYNWNAPCWPYGRATLVKEKDIQ